MPVTEWNMKNEGEGYYGESMGMFLRLIDKSIDFVDFCITLKQVNSLKI